jgi:phosphoribosylanthranilate isomerase
MIVKICGIQSVEIAKAAVECGAALLGFVFAPSRRRILPEEAQKISLQIKAAKKVGVFVDEDPGEINRIVKLCQLDYVQLHGKETAAYCRGINAPIIKAFRFGEDFSADIANAYPADLILVDSWQKGKAGGTGKPFDWQAAKKELAKLKKPCLVAGGINAANAAEAVQSFFPYGLDVSGGVEENGVKSPMKIKEFMRVVEQAERRM